MLTKVIQQQLLRAQQRMKSQADKNRSERHFEVGDSVYLKLQPYIQTTVAERHNQKLSFKYFGPFRVLQRVEQVAYKLDLPPTSRIHPVVHVSQLKHHISSKDQVSSDLNSLPDEATPDVSPVAVLDRRSIRSGVSPKTELLIQWE